MDLINYFHDFVNKKLMCFLTFCYTVSSSNQGVLCCFNSTVIAIERTTSIAQRDIPLHLICSQTAMFHLTEYTVSAMDTFCTLSKLS